MQKSTTDFIQVESSYLATLLAQEVHKESERTAKYLERLPPDKFDWAPHEKSMNLGTLAGHIVDLFAWFEAIIKLPELDFVGGPLPTVEASNPEILLENLEKNSRKSLLAFEAISEESLQEEWVLRAGDHMIYRLPRHEMIRLEMSHILHHRGQLSLYLRMLDVALPNVYGPSADEN